MYLINKQKDDKIISFPMYLHSFRFITPKKVSEAQKFALKFPNPDMITNVADKLRYYRHKKGLYQIDVADYLGINRETYSGYEEYHKDSYTPATMDKIAELFEVNVYDLLDDYNKFLYEGQGRNIKAIRKRLDITQKELAELMNVKISQIKKWEQDKSRMFKCSYEKLIAVSFKGI